MLNLQWHRFFFRLYLHWHVCDFFWGILPPDNFRIILSVCHHVRRFFCLSDSVWVFLCFVTDGESPDYQRAARPWRTENKVSILILSPTDFLSFKLWVLLICGIVHTYSCEYRYSSNQHTFCEFLLCVLNSANFNWIKKINTLVLILKKFL